MFIPIVKYALRVVPASMGNALLEVLAARTRRPPQSAEERAAMAEAGKLYYGEGNAAWSWGSGPLVILVHGWSGQAAQMAPLAQHIARLGFQAVAIDVTGHGASPKNATQWRNFFDDIAALGHALGKEVHAYVAHSAGALTTMAARQFKGIHASRYVCICAPSHPFPPIEVIRKRLDPPPAIVEHYQEHIAQQFGSTWGRLHAGQAYEGAGANLLLFYDETDRFVSHTEGDRILALCPQARLVKTKAYSHTGILTAPELKEAVAGFLAA